MIREPAGPRPSGPPRAHEVPFDIGREFDTSVPHVEFVDLLGERVAAIGVAFLIAVFSVLRRARSDPALLVLWSDREGHDRWSGARLENATPR